MAKKIGICEWHTCGECEYITNVFNREENEDAMGGCFLEGHVVTTNMPACNQFKLGVKAEEPKKKKTSRKKKAV